MHVIANAIQRNGKCYVKWASFGFYHTKRSSLTNFSQKIKSWLENQTSYSHNNNYLNIDWKIANLMSLSHATICAKVQSETWGSSWIFCPLKC